MKIGTDAVLLGAWTDVSEVKTILDVGTGTGILALMMAQRSDAIITALEIDKSSYSQAIENTESSPWKNRISVLNTSFQEYYMTTEKKYNLIISNPPFFSGGIKSPDISRSMARHTEQLSMKELLSGSKKLLSDYGRLTVILPLKEAKDFIMIAKEYTLYPSRLTEIMPKPDKPVVRILIELRKVYHSLIQNDLSIRNTGNNEYSNDYKKLTGDFYLNF